MDRFFLNLVASTLLVLGSAIHAEAPTGGAASTSNSTAGESGGDNKVDAGTSQRNSTPAAQSTAGPTAAAGQSLGAHSGANHGGYDAGARGAVNQAGANALAQSAYIDSLYANKLINRQDWLKLKAGMTGNLLDSMEQARQERDKGLLTPPPSDQASGRSPEDAATPQPPAPPEQTVDIGSPVAPSAPSGGSQGGSRTLASVPDADPSEAGASEQILDLQSVAGPVYYAGTLVPDSASTASQALQNPKASTSSEESSKHLQAGKEKSLMLASAGGTERTERENEITTNQKAVLLAQKLLQDHKTKQAAAAKAKALKLGKGAGEDEAFRQAHAKAMLSLKGLKKVKRIQDGSETDESLPPMKFTPEQVAAAFNGLPSTPSSGGIINSPWGKGTEAFSEDEELSNLGLFFMALLGLFAGLAVAYTLFLRPSKSVVQLMVPGTGEHFSIRKGTKEGDYVLDIMDVRGQLVRTAGMLRPESVARAAVLPPDLAAQLGAKGAFDRFELTYDGQFVATDKDEGYQVFPFVVDRVA